MAETLIAGRYRLDTLLGRGGMSEVWRATDLELGREVALKLLAPNEDIARFDREARAVAALGHPNVTQLYDYGEADGRPFMVLEYLRGGTLEDVLRAKGRLADDDTRRISAEIASGLAHAHARGVVHRDLKPSNVLFDEEGRAKLADFGIARMAAGDGTLTEAGTVLGTAAYISPEQAAGLPATAASDVYSFGVLLFRMLTGRLPFESDDPFTLVVRHRDDLPPRVADIRRDAPPDLAATADAALAKDPALRPELGDAVLATPSFAAEDATRVMPAAGPPPRRRRRAGPVLAVALLLLLALAGAALAYVVTRPGDAPATPATLPATSTRKTHTRSTPTTTQAPTTSTTAPTTTTPTTTTRPPTTTRPFTTTHRTPPPPPPPTTVVTTVLPPTTTTQAPPTTDTTTAPATTT